MENGLKNVLERKGWIKEDMKKLMDNMPKLVQMHKDGSIKELPTAKPIVADDVICFKTVEMLPLDQVNRNGRKFSTEAVQKAIDDLKGRSLPVRIGSPKMENWSIEHDCRDIIGFADPFIKGNELVADVRLSKKLVDKEICDLLDSHKAVPAPYGYGDTHPIGDNVIQVDNYTFAGVAIIDKNHSVL